MELWGTEGDHLLTLYLMSSLTLSTMEKYPSSSITATSPVMKNPSLVIDFSVAVGLLR